MLPLMRHSFIPIPAHFLFVFSVSAFPLSSSQSPRCVFACLPSQRLRSASSAAASFPTSPTPRARMSPVNPPCRRKMARVSVSRRATTSKAWQARGPVAPWRPHLSKRKKAKRKKEKKGKNFDTIAAYVQGDVSPSITIPNSVHPFVRGCALPRSPLRPPRRSACFASYTNYCFRCSVRPAGLPPAATTSPRHTTSLTALTTPWPPPQRPTTRPHHPHHPHPRHPH